MPFVGVIINFSKFAAVFLKNKVPKLKI